MPDNSKKFIIGLMALAVLGLILIAFLVFALPKPDKTATEFVKRYSTYDSGSFDQHIKSLRPYVTDVFVANYDQFALYKINDLTPNKSTFDKVIETSGNETKFRIRFTYKSPDLMNTDDPNMISDTIDTTIELTMERGFFSPKISSLQVVQQSIIFDEHEEESFE